MMRLIYYMLQRNLSYLKICLFLLKNKYKSLLFILFPFLIIKRFNNIINIFIKSSISTWIIIYIIPIFNIIIYDMSVLFMITPLKLENLNKDLAVLPPSDNDTIKSYHSSSSLNKPFLSNSTQRNTYNKILELQEIEFEADWLSRHREDKFYLKRDDNPRSSLWIKKDNNTIPNYSDNGPLKGDHINELMETYGIRDKNLFNNPSLTFKERIINWFKNKFSVNNYFKDKSIWFNYTFDNNNININNIIKYFEVLLNRIIKIIILLSISSIIKKLFPVNKYILFIILFLSSYLIINYIPLNIIEIKQSIIFSGLLFKGKKKEELKNLSDDNKDDLFPISSDDNRNNRSWISSEFNLFKENQSNLNRDSIDTLDYGSIIRRRVNSIWELNSPIEDDSNIPDIIITDENNENIEDINNKEEDDNNKVIRIKNKGKKRSKKYNLNKDLPPLPEEANPFKDPSIHLNDKPLESISEINSEILQMIDELSFIKDDLSMLDNIVNYINIDNLNERNKNSMEFIRRLCKSSSDTSSINNDLLSIDESNLNLDKVSKRNTITSLLNNLFKNDTNSNSIDIESNEEDIFKVLSNEFKKSLKSFIPFFIVLGNKKINIFIKLILLFSVIFINIFFIYFINFNLNINISSLNKNVSKLIDMYYNLDNKLINIEDKLKLDNSNNLSVVINNNETSNIENINNSNKIIIFSGILVLTIIYFYNYSNFYNFNNSNNSIYFNNYEQKIFNILKEIDDTIESGKKVLEKFK
uniref:Uncharacterized protein n=1 Tax=Clavaria fumosa TaxID=264083 RepID=A0A7T3PCR5_9AGAR|nr:hypothetical protein KQ422_mgp079 [Clavaria fumosa]QPZ51121.1 hypothetical protein [Clavaria fumosa]